MTNHQKLRQLPVKQLAKLLVKYCPDIDYYSRHYDYDDDYDCGDDSYYTFIQLDGNESEIRCGDEETAILECMGYLNDQYIGDGMKIKKKQCEESD